MHARVSVIVATALFPLTAGAAEIPGALARYVDGQTAAVVRLDLARLDLDAVTRRVAAAGIDTADVADWQQAAVGFVAALRKAGVTHAYAVVGSADVLSGPPFLIVPLAAGADAAAVIAAIRATPGLKALTAERRDAAVVAATPDVLRRLHSARAEARPDLAAALAAGAESAVAIAVAPTTDIRRAIEETLPQLPGSAGGGVVTALTRGLDWATLTLETTPKLAAGLAAQAKDATAAGAIAAIARSALQSATAAPADASDLQSIGKSLAGLVTTTVAGDRVTVRLDADRIDANLPAAAAAARAAANARSLRNMRQIGIAIHNYYSHHERFPADITDKSGKPILSWRVAVLPYMNTGDLYQQIRMDEPWDSEHNKSLLEKIPTTFVSPHQKSPRGTTTYLAPSGPGFFMTPGVTNRKYNDLKDGSSGTLMLVEVADALAVPWTKPADWTPDPADPLKGLLGHFPDRFNAGFGDGSVRAIRRTIGPNDLKALLTIAGNEITGPIP